MTQGHRNIIERIKASGGVITATNYGLYNQFGKYIAFPSSGSRAQNTLSSRNMFLEKFCVPFTKEETDKVLEMKKQHLERYKRLIIKATTQNKFESIKKLSEAASDLYEFIYEDNFKYFRLKDGL